MTHLSEIMQQMYTRCDINTDNRATNKTQQIYTNDTTLSIRTSYDAKTT